MAKPDMKIFPTFDYVLVRPLESEEKTASGIILPDSVEKEKPQVGEVMAVGPGHRNPEGKTIPMSFKKGQRVIYKKWGGNEVKMGKEEWLLIEEKDVIATVE